MGVPVDSPQHISFVLAVSPFFTKQEDVLAGRSQFSGQCRWQVSHLDTCLCIHIPGCRLARQACWSGLQKLIKNGLALSSCSACMIVQSFWCTPC